MLVFKRILSGTFLAAKQQGFLANPAKISPLKQFLVDDSVRSLQTTIAAGFAFKTFPKMFGTQYKKGHLNCRSRTKNTSWKRGFKVVKRPYH